VEVELLGVADCPHTGPASALLRAALDDVGLTAVSFTTTVVDSLQQADSRGFIGSPTITVDGSDLFPEPGRQPALACRIYDHPGGNTGLPDLRDLTRALKRAADGRGGEGAGQSAR
jgi:hypothetical protein